jgi:hypothetical protein
MDMWTATQHRVHYVGKRLSRFASNSAEQEIVRFRLLHYHRPEHLEPGVYAGCQILGNPDVNAVPRFFHALGLERRHGVVHDVVELPNGMKKKGPVTHMK